MGFAGSARSSSEIITQWQPPLEEHRNGQILGYMIRYRLFGYNHSPWTTHNVTNEVSFGILYFYLFMFVDSTVYLNIANVFVLGPKKFSNSRFNNMERLHFTNSSL